MTNRPEFRSWIDRLPPAPFGPLPLTHVTKALLANDIIRDGHIRPAKGELFTAPQAYLFYGRAAYRVSGD